MVERFQDKVVQELTAARAEHPAMNSLHEGFAVILEELDEFKHEVFRKNRDPVSLRHELVQLAAMCQRTAEDCNLM
ncbi:hypothetical protein LCGC14_0893260 [marine sediment metagenome]|uniref:Uncharacterized protein n=1 Tax=marine sediment metagenome TaxID=412755 RepID=A0A0F9S5L1_9ZZZZ